MVNKERRKRIVGKGWRLGFAGTVLAMGLQGCVSPDITEGVLPTPAPITTEIFPPKKTPTSPLVPTFLPTEIPFTPTPTPTERPPTSTPEPTPTPFIISLSSSLEKNGSGGPELPLWFLEKQDEVNKQVEEILSLGEEQGLFTREEVAMKPFFADINNPQASFEITLEAVAPGAEFSVGTIFTLVEDGNEKKMVSLAGAPEGSYVDRDFKENCWVAYQEEEGATATFDLQLETWKVAEENFGKEEGEKVEGRIILGGLNLRAGPSSAFGVEGNLNKGEEFQVIGRAEDPTHSGWFWCQIQLADGRQGWVSSYPGYIEVAGEVPLVLEEDLPSLPARPLSPPILPTDFPSEVKGMIPEEEVVVFEPTPAPQDQLSETILPVPIDAQDLSLSCESSAAAMAAAFVNPNPPAGFSNWERYFIESIPRHCNPHRGYRGNISGYLSTSCEDPYGYGVYAEPIADAFNKAGVPAQVEYGADYNRVADEVRAGHPVLVWISPKSVAPQYETDPETGQEYVLYLGEHCLTVIGVSSDGKKFLINDSWKGRQYWVRGFSNWGVVFGGMSVVIGE